VSPACGIPAAMMTAEMRLSIVIPTLEEAAALPATLDHLAALEGLLEVVVADGGSADGTPGVAAAHPRTDAVVEVETGGGRARQLNAARPAPAARSSCSCTPTAACRPGRTRRCRPRGPTGATSSCASTAGTASRAC
jgi:hypothetical protein